MADEADTDNGGLFEACIARSWWGATMIPKEDQGDFGLSDVF